MNSVIYTRTYSSLPICREEVLRYSGCRKSEPEIEALIDSSIKEAAEVFTYKLCFREVIFSSDGGMCDFGLFKCRSDDLANNLSGCRSAILFAATVGIGIDRLTAKYSRLSPSKAIVIQALGAERVEALCNAFCDELEDKYCGTRSRFSPGYGDLPIDTQKELFSVLDCERKIGLTLNDSMLMSPTKSVTAIVGIGKSGVSDKNKCSACDKKDCTYRGVI